MGHFEDTTVEIDFNGQKVRVAKEDAHLYEKKEKKEKVKDAKK